jgi:hypothetical protein
LSGISIESPFVLANAFYPEGHFTDELWNLHHDPVTAQDVSIICGRCSKSQQLNMTDYVWFNEARALQQWLKENKYAKQNVPEDGMCFFRVVYEGK